MGNFSAARGRHGVLGLKWALGLEMELGCLGVERGCLVDEGSFGLHEDGLIDPVVLGSRCLGVECYETKGPNGSEKGGRFRVVEGVMFTTTLF